MKKKVLIILFIIFIFQPLNTFAASIPYNGYTYDHWNEPIPTANVYEPSFSVNLNNTLNNPSDLFVDDQTGNIYILNSGEKSVIIADNHFKVIKVISKYYKKNGEEYSLIEPTGIFYKNGIIYIADSKGAKVIAVDKEGNILFDLGKPQNTIFPQEKQFIPTKVLVDDMNFVYVISQSISIGALTYDDKGNFIGFYGSNTVEISPFVLAQNFWRNFMTEKQVSSTFRFVPIEYSNFDINNESFIYTCTAIATNNMNQIKKLNPVGNNLFKSKTYGDIDVSYYKGELTATRFIDVVVNSDGFVFGLDKTRGRIYMYDDDSELVSVFGGLSDQIGTFSTPNAIDSYQSLVYVLDSSKNSIMVFNLTAYGKLLYNGTKLNKNGQYADAKQTWEKVLRQNSNCTVALFGIGKSMFYTGDYKKSMEYFKLAGDRASESKAFFELRKKTVRDVLGFVLVAFMIACVLLYVYKKFIKKKTAKIKKQTAINHLLYCMIHPVNGFSDMKYYKNGSKYLATMIAFTWFVASVFEKQYTSFRFNYSNIDSTNIFYIFISTIVIFIFFIISNWAISEIFDGEGTLKEIYIVSGYALFPYSISLILKTVLSYFLVVTEISFLNLVTIIGLILTSIMLFLGIMQIHNYSFKKNVFSIFISIVGVFIVLFLCFLVITLFQQVNHFIGTIFDEILTRLAGGSI